jgi:hypothetical protein
MEQGKVPFDFDDLDKRLCRCRGPNGERGWWSVIGWWEHFCLTSVHLLARGRRVICWRWCRVIHPGSYEGGGQVAVALGHFDLD